MKFKVGDKVVFSGNIESRYLKQNVIYTVSGESVDGGINLKEIKELHNYNYGYPVEAFASITLASEQCNKAEEEVYILYDMVPYEGSHVLGIYTSLESAMANCQGYKMNLDEKALELEGVHLYKSKPDMYDQYLQIEVHKLNAPRSRRMWED